MNCRREFRTHNLLMDGRTCVFFMVLYILILCCFIEEGLAHQNSSDQSSLLAFKAQLSSDEYKVLDNWSSSTNFCNWLGVSCNADQRVTALNLSGLSLGGAISRHFANLTFLTSLDISNNKFYGSIPSDMASLSRLRVVNVAGNNLTGDVPSWFGKFSELQQLLLRNNSFTGKIPPSLCNISKLETLDMAGNFLQGNIPLYFGNLSSVRTIILADNQFVGPIPSDIFSISSLQIINLTENSLSGTLPYDMCNKPSNLRELHLSLNNLGGEIPKELYKCKKLEILNLSNNQLGGMIPKELAYLDKLKVLLIGRNTFAGGIRKEIGNLTHLIQLDIGGNFLAGEIPASIFNISSLRVINLSNNSLSGNLPADIFESNLPSLQELNLGSNKLSGHIPLFIWDCLQLVILSLRENNFFGSISRSVGNLTSLRDLNLAENYFTGDLPTEIGNHGNLERLNVESNKLFGSVPPGIFNMSSVMFIDLQSNNFSGTLPSTMWMTLPNIQYLYLSTNNFRGMLPSSISNATKLIVLSMNEISLNGAIPDTIGDLRFLKGLYLGGNNLTRESSSKELKFIDSLTKCRSLKVLELSQNQFNGFLPPAAGNFSDSLEVFRIFDGKIWGEIPSEIGNLSSLESIVLDNNELTGFIPPTIGKLKYLEAIYLEHNRLEGFIPTEICQLKNLWDLYLNENMLSGSIPECIGELRFLGRLYLHLNNLTSTIPTSLWNLPNLFGVNLSSNAFKGHLPSEMKSSKVILELDLSRNDLSGDIPISLGSAQSLVFLSLSYNRLEGNIPYSFGKLMSLEYLDMSHNNISGMIPRSLENLKYLRHLNLSANRLKGEIPSAGPFANFTAQSFLQNYGLCGGSVRLGFPPCPSEETDPASNSKLLRYILPPILSALLITTAFMYFLVQKMIQRTQPPLETQALAQGWRRVSYHELMNATEGFSENNLIGTGSFGSVYKGTLSDQSSVAVKVFHLKSEAATGRFDAECEILSRIRHRNLVRIISCCSNENFKALVLDYIVNGNLDMWLHSEHNFLDLKQRLNIAINVASALEYLHHHHMPAVVHCDIKPSNILLDDVMDAYLCDFSIAKLFEEEETVEITKTLATIGYMAPEYGTEGRVSTSSDVYSYGVTLLEMFTKRKPTDDIFGEGLNLKQWVNDSLHKHSIIEVVDGNLIGRGNESLLEEVLFPIFHLAIDCLTDSPQDRIDMKNVAARLQRINANFLKNFYLNNKQVWKSKSCRFGKVGF